MKSRRSRRRRYPFVLWRRSNGLRPIRRGAEKSSRGSSSIVRAVVAMCSSLSIGTVAEGVETNEQLERLKNEGCTEAQGYLFSPPKSVTDVKTWLAAIASPRLP